VCGAPLWLRPSAERLGGGARAPPDGLTLRLRSVPAVDGGDDDHEQARASLQLALDWIVHGLHSIGPMVHQPTITWRRSGRPGSRLKPKGEVGPPGSRWTWRERLTSLRRMRAIVAFTVVAVVAVVAWLAVSTQGENCHYNVHLAKRIYCSED
jgi:hypothetical protein